MRRAGLRCGLWEQLLKHRQSHRPLRAAIVVGGACRPGCMLGLGVPASVPWQQRVVSRSTALPGMACFRVAACQVRLCKGVCARSSCPTECVMYILLESQERGGWCMQ